MPARKRKWHYFSGEGRRALTLGYRGEGPHSNRCTARGIMKEPEPNVDSVAGQRRAELLWGESKGTYEGKVAAPITSQMLVCRDPTTLLAGTCVPVSDGVHTGPFKAALL